ncbi:hypothetical protein HG694_01245 [Citrobacter freundii]|nr:hypothetical protein [Citrobacter freundii]
MTVYEMEGFLRGKCLPVDMKVNESNAQYLVRKFSEFESNLSESKREFRAADATIHNLELKLTDMAVQLANSESKCRELAAENSNCSASDLYIALRTESDTDALSDKHITVCYMSASATSKLDVNSIMPQKAKASVVDVVYWERANLTVAIIDSPEAYCAYEASMASGFTYDLEFIPHVTLGCGDATSEHKNLVGKTLSIGSPYIRLKQAKKKTTATSPFLAEVRAQGVDAAIDHLSKKFEGTGHIGVPVMALEWLAQELRKGAAL